MALPEASTLGTDVPDDLSRAHEAYVALQVYRVYCQLQSAALSVQDMQAALDEEMRRFAQKRIEAESAQRAANSKGNKHDENA